MEFRKTFEVARDAESLWQSLEGAKRDGRWWMPGFLSTATEIDSEPPHRLVVTKDSEPCAGTQIAVTFEGISTGTRVTIVQSGFGSWINSVGEAFRIGWDDISGDFAAFLAFGVDPRRHARPWGDLGCTVDQTASGLQVGSVRGGIAGSAGLRPGDLLVAVGSAPIYSERELITLMRFIEPGAEVALTYVREASVHAATARA